MTDQSVDYAGLHFEEPDTHRCDACGRYGWYLTAYPLPCAMTQPDGRPCPGTLRRRAIICDQCYRVGFNLLMAGEACEMRLPNISRMDVMYCTGRLYLVDPHSTVDEHGGDQHA